jgi:hypothetical protein
MSADRLSDDRDRLEAIDQPSVHHEESDVNIRAIFGFAGGLLLVTVVVGVAVWGLFLLFERREARVSGPSLPLATEVREPPEPRLQVTPREDAAAFRAQEDAILNGYSWVDRDAGLVRIPIAEAMRLTVQKGLPVREQKVQP